MSAHRVTSVRSGPASQEAFLAKLLAYIPAEVIAGYQAITGFFEEPAAGDAALQAFWWVVLLIILVITPLWMALTSWSATHSTAWKFRVAASPFAFAVWTFALGGPWLAWLRTHNQAVYQHHGVYASTLLILITLILPLAEKTLETFAQPPTRQAAV